jgi:AcrR family transcriptional regulator
MENTARSERTRNAVIQAALAIIARDGPGRLTLDAIARESGISKGGLMHQFRTKAAVLKALLEHQIEHHEAFARDYLGKSGLGKSGSSQSEPNLAVQIATAREAIAQPHSVAFAILGAVAEEPGFLSVVRESNAKKIEGIKAEAADPELAMLRWEAAYGLTLTAMFGLCPLSGEERERLFDRLLDSRQWAAFTKADT